MAIDRTIKILLVEDSTFVRKASRRNLNDLGFENVIEAIDGNDAIKKLLEEPDLRLIISDWVMPHMDGYEFLVWVRSNKRFKDTPFIMATARGEKKHVTKATEAGVTDFITKPFVASEVEALIEGIFTVNEPGQAAPKTTRRRFTPEGKRLLRVAHIQITDHLILGILKHMLATDKLSSERFELETVCMPSWNPVQKALETGEVDVAFVLAPIAMDLFSFGVPIKLVLFAHKNGSIFVRKRDSSNTKETTQFFRNKTFYIPHELSIHHMLSHKFLRGLGLRPGFEGRGDFDVFFEVVPPVKMPEFMAANSDAIGFSVAEPLGTQTIAAGNADLLFLSGEIWENHPCCVVAVRDELVEQDADVVQEFVNLLVEAGQFINNSPETAASMGVPFLDPDGTMGLKSVVLCDVLKETRGIKTNDMLPVAQDLDIIQQYMANEMGIGTPIDLERFIDARFAEIACQNLIPQQSIMHDVSRIVNKVMGQQAGSRISKTRLNLEGKYLTFAMGDGEYGLDVMHVKEIIDMRPIRPIPQSEEFVKGIINLRGEVVPVIDFRLKLGMGASEYDERARIIVLQISGETETLQMGIVVDSVSDVIDIKSKEIDDTPSLVTSVDTNYILGVAKIDGSMKMLLDMKQLFR
ncbi:MAG: ABC transporter substrate-binding protein [Chloroflexi bacterium]|nr:ABC transporter substrate-binding protein [Chloroflexota bacterium]